jgi:hypothetical protein
MQFAGNNRICGGVYGIRDSQLGDGPMNLPLELQRRLDRRWSARFRTSEKGSRPETARTASAPRGCSMQGSEDTTVIDVPKRIGN